MKPPIIVLLLLLPFFVSSQNLNPPSFKNLIPNTVSTSIYDRPILPKLETVKPIHPSRKEISKAKLRRKEQKLIQLARKAWEIELNLKSNQKDLTKLESTLEENNTSDFQKNIEKIKMQIAKNSLKLSKAKTKVDLKSKEVKDLEAAIENSKFIREDN